MVLHFLTTSQEIIFSDDLSSYDLKKVYIKNNVAIILNILIINHQTYASV